MPVGSARRRVIQTSTGAVQLPVGRDVVKWLLLTKIKDKRRKYHLRLTEAVKDSEETVEGRTNNYPD